MIFISILYFLFCIIVSVGILKGILTFGLGLGDLVMLGALLFCLIITILGISYRWYFVSKLKYWNNLIMVFEVLSILYFLLSMSLWRGSEYPWNGKFLMENSFN
jgi:hypothetical protein